MFPPPSNHAKHSGAVVIHHVPIFPTSSEDHTVCEMDRVTLLFRSFAYCRHMSVAIHRCQMKEAQSVFFGKHMPVAQRQKILHHWNLNFSLSPACFFFFSFFMHSLKWAWFHLRSHLAKNLYAASVLQLEGVSLNLSGWLVKNLCDFTTQLCESRQESWK